MASIRSAFCAFLIEHRPPLSELITADLQPVAPVPEESVQATLTQWLAALEQPEMAVRLLDTYVQQVGSGPISLIAITNTLAIYRRNLLDAGLQAVSAAIPDAVSGLKSLMQLIDLLMARVAEIAMARTQAQAERIERIIEGTPLSMIEFDRSGAIKLWNESAERIFGWSAAEALGKNVFQLLVPSIAAEHVQGVVDMLLSGSVANSRNENITKSGEIILCQWYNAVLRDSAGNVVGVLSQTEDITEQIRIQEQLLATQEETLRELSTPLIPVADGLVIMPLIGSIDSRRAQQVIESLLQGVTDHRAAMVILDITGVPIVDTQVAGALLRAAQAVNLLGARVVLTGIRPEIAQTLVGLGVDLGQITTRGSLQSGIAYALGREQVLRVRT
jgi:PAS domain S-box-containing protein